VTVGQYSYGYFQNNSSLPPGTFVGRYCSIADGIRVFRRNHPADRVSTHPFFYNAMLDVVAEDTITTERDNPLIIGNDVWIGHQVTILPKCQTIGNGAILGAGAVVTRNVPAYAIVAGNPARIIEYRFSNEIIEILEDSKWWELSLENLEPMLDVFSNTLTIEKAIEIRDHCLKTLH
jgi:virginiamycin A acetyltransferase